MFELTILCHPCTPVAPTELEDWLQHQVDRLRTSSPELIVRLSRLAQELPDSEITGGWLIELELADESHRDHDPLPDVLADVLTDMRFLGMQPTVLLPLGISDLARALGKALSEPPVGNGPVLDYPGLK
jgi:hypothetical protein